MYLPETYWDSVAERIKKRTSGELIAGDEEPYYRYKRNKFLKLLNSISFKDKKVLEVGSGPGGNLLEIYQHNPKEVFGADISRQMIDISRTNVGDRRITIVKTNGKKLSFPDNCFELTFTSTVLQHISDEDVLEELIKEMCRISESDIYIFERIEKKNKRNESNIGRTIEEYSKTFSKNSFYLLETRFLYIHWSYLVCGGIRKLFNKRNRQEGEPLSKISIFLQKPVLLFTRILDVVFKVKRDLAMLHFKRWKPESY